MDMCEMSLRENNTFYFHLCVFFMFTQTLIVTLFLKYFYFRLSVLPTKVNNIVYRIPRQNSIEVINVKNFILMFYINDFSGFLLI